MSCILTRMQVHIAVTMSLQLNYLLQRVWRNTVSHFCNIR